MERIPIKEDDFIKPYGSFAKYLLTCDEKLAKQILSDHEIVNRLVEE